EGAGGGPAGGVATRGGGAPRRTATAGKPGHGCADRRRRRTTATAPWRRRGWIRGAVPGRALRLGRGVAVRLRLLRVHHVRLGTFRGLAAAQRGRAVRLRFTRLPRQPRAGRPRLLR